MSALFNILNLLFRNCLKFGAYNLGFAPERSL
jgi:hypothetical protein